MPDVHSIRLRGPWQFEVLARYELQSDGTSLSSSADLPSPGRITMPADWGATLGADFRGKVRYRRVFHWPSKLMPDEQAWLVLEAADSFGVVSLDEQVLGEVRSDGPPAEFEITSFLQPDHELVVEIDLPALANSEDIALRGSRQGQPGGLIGEVRLEIRT